MIIDVKVHQCDHSQCGQWQEGEMHKCAVCDKEFCQIHLNKHLILTTRNIDQHSTPIAAFPPMCCSCAGDFNRIKPRAFAQALIDLMKDPNNLKKEADHEAAT
jgi:hypothetical protein